VNSSAVANFRLTAAAEYAALGWRVVPLHWVRTSPTVVRCSCGKSDCGSPGKHPLTANGLKDASSDGSQLAAWWSEWPAANIGIATGAASGIVVIDVDPRDGGNDSLGELCDAHGQLPETVEAGTGGGGLHLYFRHPGTTIRNSAGKLGVGIDVRGDGGYVVAAPSIHVSRSRYRWLPECEPREDRLAAMPDWLVALLREPAPKPPAPMSIGGDDAGRHWLGKALARAGMGGRNDRGHWLACQLRDNGIGLGEAERLMAEYARRCPQDGDRYTEREAVATVRSAYKTAARGPAKSLSLPAVRPTGAAIAAVAANATSELRDYMRDVVDRRIVDARLPWPLLSKLSCAMLPGSVTTLVGDPGVGKTFWTLECLRFWHGNGHDPAAFFIEKNRRFYSMRLLAQLEGSGAYVDHEWIAANGDAVNAAVDRHGDYIADLGRCIHSSECGRVSLPDVLNWVRQMASAGKRVLIVDPITAVNAGNERWVADDDFMVEASRICIAHGTSLLLVTHPKGGASSRKSGHDAAGGAAYFRFCDSLIWIKRPKKARRVRVRCVSSVGVKEIVEKHSTFFEMHKTRDGKGAGMELAYSFGDGLHFAEHGIVMAECAEGEGEAA
jgi:hypothetical protein